MQVLSEPTPTTNYIIDDAGALSKTTRKAVSDRLKKIEFETGFRVEAVTVRKLEVEADAFAFTDRLLESWCPPPPPPPSSACPPPLDAEAILLFTLPKSPKKNPPNTTITP